MVAGDLMDEMDCNSFFDQMDDLSGIWSNPLPYEDIAQLEWLSNFVEDSFSGGGLTITKGSLLSKESSSEESQTSSAFSTGSSSCSGEKGFPRSPAQRGVRTKRARPTTFNPPAFLSSKVLSGQEAIMTPHPGEKSPKPVASTGEKKRKKKIKLSIPRGPLEANQNQNVESVRKCMHCEITKTPQWRAGPMGPKTLCNACGVRYKSGRLFPEYRPAASPTFMASVHSNSHRKVLEMRSRSDEKRSIFLSEAAVAPELIPNSRVSFD